jgi:hypothetical protein
MGRDPATGRGKFLTGRKNISNILILANNFHNKRVIESLYPNKKVKSTKLCE